MSEPIIDSFLSLLTLAFGYEPGTQEFYVVLGVTLFVFFLIARLLVGIFGSSAKLLGTLVAMVLPPVLGGLAYAMVEVYALPRIDAGWAPVYLPWAGFGVLVLVSIRMISRRLLSLGSILTLFIFVLSAVAAAGASYGTQVLVDFMDKSSTQMEKREERLKEEVEGISPSHS